MCVCLYGFSYRALCARTAVAAARFWIFLPPVFPFANWPNHLRPGYKHQSLSGLFSVPLPDCRIFFFLLQNGKDGYEKWRVENSWGDDRGNKGTALKIPSLCLCNASPLTVGPAGCRQHSEPLLKRSACFCCLQRPIISLQFPACVYRIKRRIRLKWKPVLSLNSFYEL